MQYRYAASSPEGLVQQLAVSYLRHGYWWYVTGTIPRNKSPDEIDRKLLAKYGIDLSEWHRSARKSRGLANMQYLRYHRWFILLATEGHHPFKSLEQPKDCRRHPIHFHGYSISYRRGGITPKGGEPAKWHACVRIDDKIYKQLKAHFMKTACHRSVANLTEAFRRIPYARYAPVRRQLLNILRAVNRARSQHNFDPVPVTALRLRRKIVLPFAESTDAIRMRA